MTEQRALLPVTAEDRREAFPFVSRNSIAGQDRAGYMAGAYDDTQAVQAFAAHRLSSEKDGWRPIAEAPRDKTEVLLANDALVTPARFIGGKWMAPGYNGVNIEFHPTHFRLLPSPPATPDSVGGEG